MNFAYDKRPSVGVRGRDGSCVRGWDAVAARLDRSLGGAGAGKKILVVEFYPGVDQTAVRAELASRLKPSLSLDAASALRSREEIGALVEPFLGEGDPVFGRIADLSLDRFFAPERLEAARRSIAAAPPGLVLVVGCGARLIAEGDLLVYADLPRWEAQARQRRNVIGNLGAENRALSPGLKYKRAFFVDWRVADAWKRGLMARWDFVLETNDTSDPKMAEGGAVREALDQVARQPFRFVPTFDPAPWGGQWMKGAFGLDSKAVNYGWCFDCVPEENSLILDFGGIPLELPALDLIFHAPQAVLGPAVYGMFGAEFPIRFDFLDTIGGGNLSLQVHPLTDYIRRHFGMGYTQDESYYIFEAAPDATVYLGLREDVDPAAMRRELDEAQGGGPAFAAERHVCRWPARRHDHFLIPAGTVHCSGANTVVLEVSATPYIFTFKMWDWGRVGLDGKPRPIHLRHAAANLQWDRREAWVRENLVNHVVPVDRGDGWVEEATGLHAGQFIETRRHWFDRPVPHKAGGGVNVLNLVAGPAAVVESPDGTFPPFIVHHAETFIVPAAAGSYRISPLGAGSQWATLKAAVRVSPA